MAATVAEIFVTLSNVAVPQLSDELSFLVSLVKRLGDVFGGWRISRLLSLF